MNGLLKKVGLTLTLLTGIGAYLYGSLPKETKEMDLKYQGFFPKDGYNIMVFDSKPMNERKGNPEYQIPSGLDTNLYNFETDKKYKIKVEKHNFEFFFPDKVTSMSKDTTN